MKRSTIPLGKNFGSKALSSLRMILSSASHERMLLSFAMLVMMVLLPQGVKAETITTSYDFNFSQSDNKTITWSEETESGCTFFETVGGSTNYTRFATQGTNWNLTTKAGLYSGDSGGRNFIVKNLYAGDVVTFNVSTNASYGTDVAIVSNGTKNGNSFTVTSKGSLVVTIPRNSFITSITIQHETSEAWGYDPAIETYDLYNNTDGIASNNLKPAGFPLDANDYEAQYLTNLNSGLALNDRIAISQVEWDGVYTPWQIDHGFKSLYNWHNISITNLVEGDRVVITWMGSAKFSSKAEQTAYNGCAAFKDVENNGDFDEGQDTQISLGMSLDAKTTRWDYNANANIYTSYPYVITEDGHLDIALAADSKIVKVVIYADHQAEMVDRDNELGTSTSYFNTTGQLEAKHHIVPGGLHVYVGNEAEKEHAEVVMSDKGPVSFVYDDLTSHDANSHHYKMARQGGWGIFDVWQGLPVTGTYYKFVPEVSGKMWVKFKASSVNYRNYGKPGNAAVDDNGTPNEVTNTVSCPYYLMVANDNNKPTQVECHNYSNGADGYFGNDSGNPTSGQDKGITVERGKTYYLYGWWDVSDVSALNDINNHACGIAELLEVTFLPNQMVEPLAKWVESGTTSDGELATVKGYNTVKVKKKSSNIASCEPYIEDGKLKIRNITFVDPNKGGGTILIKIGDPNIDGDPVFAYTIAYNAGYNPQTIGKQSNGDDAVRSEGHTWNFSDNPLKALQWNDKSAEADVVDFGTHFNNFASADKDENGIPTNGVNNSSFLTYEYDKGDWTFNYRVKKNGQFHDPRFLNNYDMEGDNADMMWDTEGIIINAGSTQSCIFNEFGGTIAHNESADPDRYVGFLEGGSFIIPKLKKDDRVLIYMGSGAGSGSGAMEFHITNALDAMHNPIDPEDFYHAGGSQWNTIQGHGDPYYRGCYHFFAKEDGDMEFKMAGGSMCKLYMIKIYTGEHENTNSVQEDGKGYTIFASKDKDGNVVDSETNSWNLHYRGKGETIADGTGKFNQENEIIAHSGNITHYDNSDLVRVSNQGVSYTNQGEIGMLRVRVKCMEYNHNYVTDYADRNMTLALHETQGYPYTWDFTDIDGFSSQDVAAEYTNYPETNLEWNEKGYDLSIWDEDGAMILYGPKGLRENIFDYTNQNMLFENSKGIYGNQLWANDDVIPETQGLWFYMDNNDPAYNGSMQITEDGLRLANTKKLKTDGSPATMGWWNYKMVVPAVPNGAAVYLRMKRDPSVADGDYSQKTGEDPVYFLQTAFNLGTDAKTYLSTDTEVKNGTSYSFYKVDGSTDEWILAVKNTKDAASNLIFTLNGWIVEKLSVSQDPKAVNTKGWTSESRNHDIDATLTAYLTGKDMKTYFAGQPNYKNRTLVLTDVGSSVDNHVMPANTGCVIFNATDENKANILNDGFHLFVPDMHDTEKLANAAATVDNAKVNMLKAQLGEIKPLPEYDDDAKAYTNYVLSYKYYQYDSSGNYTGTGVDGPEMFYRVANTGIGLRANSAYLPLPTSEVKPANWDSVTTHAKYSFVFADYDDLVFDISSIATDIEAVDTDAHQAQDGWYNLNGQKLKGKPSANGLYIVNGKKVLVK
ncbi:MAG: hypothetical protein IKT00_14870 [Prevotella sp.]|nr:hypothetical protein [Prevotella sp.]